MNDIKILYEQYPLATIGLLFFFAGLLIAAFKRKWYYFWIGFLFTMLLVSLSGYSGITKEEGLRGTFGYAAIIAVIYMIKYDKYRKKQKTIDKYKETSYYKQTQTDYEQLMNTNIGRYGEWKVFDELQSLEEKGSKFLFNAYIPKGNDEYTEIDIIIINASGLYVIESKNYSGWIFGEEHSQRWMQILNNDRHQFYNPILQNKTHCKYLGDYLKIDSDAMVSYIVFSDRCEFKKIPDNTSKCKILHRKHLMHFIEEDIERRTNVFNEAQIEEMYNKLFDLTQADESIKNRHIERIKENRYTI